MYSTECAGGGSSPIPILKRPQHSSTRLTKSQREQVLLMTPYEYQQRAYFLFERDRFREAAAVCLEGLNTDPDDVDLLFLRGLCGLRLNDRKLTQTSIESLAACAPNWPCTHDLLCFQALEHDWLDAAERHCREAIRGNPEAGGRFGTLAYVFERLGRREDAITAARQGLALDPDNLQLLTLLQRLYQLNGETDSRSTRPRSRWRSRFPRSSCRAISRPKRMQHSFERFAFWSIAIRATTQSPRR